MVRFCMEIQVRFYRRMGGHSSATPLAAPAPTWGYFRIFFSLCLKGKWLQARQDLALGRLLPKL